MKRTKYKSKETHSGHTETYLKSRFNHFTLQMETSKVVFNGPTPGLFLFIFVIFKNSFYRKNCRLDTKATVTISHLNQLLFILIPLYQITARTGRAVQKGENLSIMYTHSMWGTASRRDHLFNFKKFWCKCQRCADATEFGKFFVLFPFYTLAHLLQNLSRMDHHIFQFTTRGQCIKGKKA